MKEIVNLPSKIPVFPLSNFIIFPDTMVPLNIFEPRYIQMIDDCMKSDRIIGMIQPKNSSSKIPELYNIGCAGKITSFNETNDGRYLIVLNGISRFKIIKEINSERLYRKFDVSFTEYNKDTSANTTEIKFSDLELIFKNLKSLFRTKGYSVNWKELEQQSLDQTINTLSMASPFSLEEKQILLESVDLKTRKQKLEEILNTYLVDSFGNKTIQ
tara:strand:- start:2667 stop:3308 length:642 start_codon:yes stop_codon:yes gene_type:complete